MKKRVGIFSGTFDPFHIGHIEVCLVSKGALELDEVLVMIEKNPRRKQVPTDFEHRKEMVKLSLGDFSSMHFFEHSAPNITFENTTKKLETKFKNTDLVLIIGSDVLDHIADWIGFDTWASKYSLAVVLRDNKDKTKVDKQINALAKRFPKLKINLLPAVWSPVSSSSIRAELKKDGHSNLVHRNTLSYIKQKNLYKK